MTGEVWMGYLVDHHTEYTVAQSPFVLDGVRVFGADSDATTLAIAAVLHRLQHDNIGLVTVPEGMDSATVAAACNLAVWDDASDAEAEWDLLLSDEAIVVLARRDADVELFEMDVAVEVDEPFHRAMEEAWRDELSLQHVSQGAYVSQAQYEEAARPRLFLQGQVSDEKAVWPPRFSSTSNLADSSRVRLKPCGRVLSWTTLSAAGAPSEFALRAPLLGGVCTVLLALDDGPNGVFLVVDDEDAEAFMDAPVELVVRRIYAQEGFIRYGLKARLILA